MCKFYLLGLPLLAPFTLVPSPSQAFLEAFPLLPSPKQTSGFQHSSLSLMTPRGSDSKFLSIPTPGTEVLTVAKKGLRSKLANA